MKGDGGNYMAIGERSLSDVLQAIIRNVQEIVRSEVRLAKTEIREEAVKAKSSAVLLGAGAVAAGFGILFLLLTIFYSLAFLMPFWASALVVGAALAIIASVMLTAGIKQFKQIQFTPERTVETIKENVEWAKQQAK
jgi:uncharacterized membrane protein YqjE